MLRLFKSSFFESPLCSIELSVVGVVSRMFITGFYVKNFLYLIFKFPFLSPLCALGVNPTSYTMDTGCLPGVQQPERDVDHQPQR